MSLTVFSWGLFVVIPVSLIVIGYWLLVNRGRTHHYFYILHWAFYILYLRKGPDSCLLFLASCLLFPGSLEILRYAQNDNADVIPVSCLLSLVSCFLFPDSLEILRYAQNDNAVVIRDSCILSLVSCLLFPVSI